MNTLLTGGLTWVLVLLFTGDLAFSTAWGVGMAVGGLAWGPIYRAIRKRQSQ